MRDLFPAGSAERAEATGLLALMLLTESRASARVSAAGELVRLDEQDRDAWDRALIDEGLALVDDRDFGGAPGRYQLLSAINAVHVSAPRARDTDWSRIVTLYTALEHIDPSPIVTLNKAIAVSEYDSPHVALALIEPLAGALDRHHALHATRAELLRQVGRTGDALLAYDRAIDLAGNTAEVAHLTRRRTLLAASTNGETS